ncbi:MAG TPA: DUF3429 domain-containing protein [Thiomicrospira sp.]|jgi:hypothetical protein|nr:DUF3429 domain-containing protein [Thiomicrospira sp.]
MHPVNIARTLTYLGTLPFWYGALFAFDLAPLSQQITINFSEVLIGYAAVILSFIAGIHWGVALSYLTAGHVAPKKSYETIALFICSNVIALWAWAMLLWTPTSVAFFGLALAFVCLIFVDWKWANFSNSQPWFWKLRWHASSVAILSMLLNAFMS